MKKALAILLSMILCLSLAACSSSDDSSNSSTGSNSTSTTGTTSSTSSEGENPITHYKSGDVTLGEYRGLTYTPESVEVTEEEIEEYIQYLLSTKASLTEKAADAVAEKGDVVSVEFVGKLDGVAFDGGTGTKDDLELGSGSFIEDFENGLIGKGLGTYDVPCTFPETYHSEALAGKDVIFEITVTKICSKVAPEFDDAFCNDYSSGEYSTTETFTQYLKESIQSYKQDNADSQKTTDLTIAVINGSTFNKDITSEVEESKTSIENYYNSYCSAYYGVDAKTFYMAQYGLTEEQYNNMILDQAEMSVKYRYITSAIAEKENITVTDAEATAFAEANYASLGYSNVDDFLSAIESQQEITGLEFCKEQVKLDKANEIVMSTAVAATE